VLAGLAAASVQGIVALGHRRGARVRRLGEPPETIEAPTPGRCHARSNGFDLHAGLVVPAGQRERLEGVCRDALRPPVACERLRMTGNGRVRLQVRRRWADGTTHLEWDAVDFLGRLAVLVPRPRINLILYHGVLAPRAAWRSAVVRHATSEDGRDAAATEPVPAPHGQCAEGQTSAKAAETARSHTRNRLWADLMRRTFGFDVLACPRCGGRLRLIALIEQAAAIERILRHLRLPARIPAPYPARAPPLAAREPDVTWWAESPVVDPCS
jgi:hypothetical protein